jgi:hypothetical protein
MPRFPNSKQRRTQPAPPPPHQSIDLATTTEWIELRTRILTALEPYPDALAAMLESLREEPQ